MKGYDGLHCEIAENCTNGPKGSPCQNEGVVMGKTGNCTCACKAGYTGSNCEITKPCKIGSESSPDFINCIHGNATGLAHSCKCSCKIGYSGEFCQIPNPCESGPDGKKCLNGGTHAGFVPNCTCNCPEGYTGPNCDRLKNCSRSSGTSNCNCISPCTDENWHVKWCYTVGKTCGSQTTNWKECDGNIMCENNGVPSGKTGDCSCNCNDTRYSGDVCDVPLPCTTGANNTSCKYSGKAIGTTGECSCKCPPFYSGDHCECRPGYSGENCENAPSPNASILILLKGKVTTLIVCR